MKSSLLQSLPDLSRAGKGPLFRQLADWLRAQVQAGVLTEGDRVPPVRELAELLEINRATVQTAYRELENEGVLRSRVGSGTFVQGRVGAAPSALRASAQPWRPRFTDAAESALGFLSLTESPERPRNVVADFSQLFPDERQFPVKSFAASMRRVLQRDSGRALGYAAHRGLQPLRELIARRLTDAGTPTDPRGILITNGAQQGIELVVRALVPPGERVLLGAPTYHLMLGLLRGLDVLPAALRTEAGHPDDAALRHALAGEGARLLYAMPTFHNPTGLTWDRAQRERCLEVTGAFGCPVLEDDFEQDLRFAGTPQPTLRALCPNGRVVSVGTISKGLFPGARLGWVAGTPEVIDRLAALKRFSDLSSSLLLQAVLLDFIERGGFDQHLATVRASLLRKHTLVQGALEEHLQGLATWTRPEGGYALWVTFPSQVDSRVLAVAARDAGVLVAPGFLFDPDGAPGSSVRLAVSCVQEAEIPKGIEVLARVARSLAERTSPAVHVFL